MRCAIVHYHELALKGRNREYFEERLVRNIQWTLRDLGVRRVENLRSRIRVVLPDTVLDKTIIERLTRVFGIANWPIQIWERSTKWLSTRSDRNLFPPFAYRRNEPTNAWL
jgi:adenylyl- and sulfurtransferase ThiI